MTRGRYRARQWAVLAAAAGTLAGMHACTPDGPDGGLPTHPSDGFSVKLEWDAPTLDAAGQPLEDLAGYRLYSSPALPPTGADAVRLDLGLEERVTVSGLPAGVYFFAVTALDTAGNESDLSAPLEVDIGR